jgi:hypothetical protein
MYRCDICNKSFDRKDNLNRHNNSKIICRDRYRNELKPFFDKNNNIPIEKIKEFYIKLDEIMCIYCDKVFSTKNHLLFHINENCKEYKRMIKNNDDVKDNTNDEDKKNNIKEINGDKAIKENELIEKVLREKEIMEKELKDLKELREKELRERELREKELRERELREKELREKELMEKELKILRKLGKKETKDKEMFAKITEQLFNLLKNQEKNNIMNTNNSNNTINSNNGNTTFNFQYIEKNFNTAENLEDTIKIENISEDMYKTCSNKYINEAAKYIFKKLCIDDRDVKKRAIHCLDLSRKKYAVKTENKWLKDCGGSITRSICQPIITDAYEKIIDKVKKEEKYSPQTVMDLMVKYSEYKLNDGFNKTLYDTSSDLILGNNKNDEIIHKIENNDDVKNDDKVENDKNDDDNKDVDNIDIYLNFMKTKTKKSKKHIHTKELYDHFCDWYEKNISKENIPSNKTFIQNIKHDRLHYKSIKIGDKVSSGFKNLELC